jgi:glycerol-3-phosphate O-acyltransferase / dihydroxyacetone phosphate acyltransferase
MQLLMWLTLHIYFKRIVFKNIERLKSKGPLLVISNHPNTVIDPLVALYRMPAICHLLANYSLFKNPISRFLLTNLFCIPIQRYTDVPEGQALQNDKAFQKCDEHLLSGGCLYIAVEGTSWPERVLREFKTGMARIAFSAEMKTDFKLDLRVLPIGISYSDGLKFRSEVRIEIGELISADEWQAEYLREPRKTIQTFTDHVENKMRDIIIDCRNAEEDAFLKKLEAVLNTENPLNTEGGYQRSKKLLVQLHAWEKSDETAFNAFKNKVESYFSKLNTLKINDVNSKKQDFHILTKLLLGFPIGLYGFINNIIPAWLSDKMISWLKQHEAYDTTVRYVSGLIFFPLFWWLQAKVVKHFFNDFFNPNLSIGWLYFFTVVPTGLAAWWFYKNWKAYLDFLTFKKADKNGALQTLRQDIVGILTLFLPNFSNNPPDSAKYNSLAHPSTPPQ